jgi:glycerol-3-phosphate dehydrogenase
MTAAAASYDLIVIGGGINGAAIAREAALSGQRVLLLEKTDLGAGTSAASTRLIHGGLRYLEHGELGLVHESLGERERLLRLAPHLVRPLELCLPLYRSSRRPPWQLRIGLSLYDLLSLGKSLPRHRMLGRAATLERLPSLRQDGLVGAAAYFDAQLRYPERLVLENVIDAVGAGAQVETQALARRVRVEHGRVSGVDWERDGHEHFAAAGIVVNAAGPWVDDLAADFAERRLIGGTKGSHLVLRPFPGAPSTALYAEAVSDGRPFFVIPWNDLYLIGTTDERFDGDPAAALPSRQEFDYLVSETERLLPSSAGLADRVCYVQAGVRPLPSTAGVSTSAITRRHLIEAHTQARGLYSIVGGKLTTHRALAVDVMRRLRRELGTPRGSPTAERALPGALAGRERTALLDALSARVGPAQAERLWSVYGGRAALLLADIERSAELAQAVGPGSPIFVAELVHGIEREWARTLVDLLQRRCMAGLDAHCGLEMAPAAADWLFRLGLWDKRGAEAELAAYRAHARRFRVPGAGASVPFT